MYYICQVFTYQSGNSKLLCHSAVALMPQARLRAGSANGSNGSLSGLTEETPSPSGFGIRDEGGGEAVQVERSAKSMLRSMSLRERIRRTESAFRDGSLEPAGAWQVCSLLLRISTFSKSHRNQGSGASIFCPACASCRSRCTRVGR